jgi:D-glycero-alpha-D-manno-heptose-7-phosphate kinase
MVDEAAQLLASKADLRGFGELLHEAWLTKRQLSEKVTNPQVDALYEDARAAGAIGGKLLGAGGGGFMVLLVPPERQEDVRRRLNRLIHVPFEFEFSGSQIIFFDPEQDYAEHDRRRAEQDIEAFREIE